MEAFALYLLKSMIWLTGFALVYFLFLQNERFFRLKRYYLIAGILISLIFPLFTFHYQVDMPAPAGNFPDLIPSKTEITPSVQIVLDDKQFDFRYILLFVYFSGILFFVFRALKNSSLLLKTINKTKVNGLKPTKIVRTSDFSSSFSFFNYVFINPSVDGKELNVIMNHELVHVNQKHWLDLLLVELLRMIQWINPFAWIYSGFIRQNHEYIADEMALKQTPDPAVYKAVLVNQLFGSKVFSLSNSFNYSLNKKRFDMMKKIIISPYRKMRLLLVLPVFAFVFYAFARPEYHYVTPSGSQMNPALTSESIQKEAKGVVVNEQGTPLQGVTIVVAKSLAGVITDAKGRFAISRIPDGSSLIFSCKGYKTYTLPPLIASNSALYVKLVKDPDYREQAEVRIINTDGSEAKPLVVVDGTINEKQDLKEINPNTILSINVLKDKASTDKYGDKGKYGVIEITTNQKTVKGIVVNSEGQPIEKVAINTTGTAGNVFATETGKDGRFELYYVQADASIQFFCRGYKLLSLKPDFNKEMSVKMEKDPEYKAPVAIQRPTPLVVIDGMISEKNYRDAFKDLGYDLGPVKLLPGKEATVKYGEKGANGVYEITTRTKAIAMGIKSPLPRLGPDDYPTFQNQGFGQFNYWVANQVKYPPEAQAKKLEGWIQINFTVELDGTLSNIKPAANSDPVLSEEVMRVIRNSPKWDRPKNPAVEDPYPSNVNIGFRLPDQIIKEPPFVVVEEMPMYPGGEGELLKFIAENTKYPEAAKADTIQGKVIVRFIVNTEGNTEGITVLKGVHPLLDAEAVRVVKLLSGFKPGMQGGKAVNVWYMVPINFTLPYTKKN
ncbi:MAG: TonB family protein [Bacteroidia bacterium]|nr:TonB family protein [Bacteroidia bacterium]